MGRRVVAYLVDLLIALVITVPIFFSVAEQEPAGLAEDPFTTGVELNVEISLGDTRYFLEGGAAGAYFLAGVALSLLLGVVVPAVAGGSLGKLAVGLRVVGDDGRIAGFGRMLVRYLFLFIDAFFFLGFFVALGTDGHRRVGDLVASTRVVERAAVGTAPTTPQTAYGPGGVPQRSPAVDEPVWNAEHQAWLRFDPASGRWFRHDDAAQRWTPLG